MKLLFLLFSLAAADPVFAMWDLNPRLDISPDGKYFAASFNGNLNIGTINGTDKKFTNAVALGDSFDWQFLGFTPDGKKLAIMRMKEAEIRYYSLDGKYLGKVEDARPRFMSTSFKWFVDSRNGEKADHNRLCALTQNGCGPKFDLSGDLAYAAFDPGDKLAALALYRPWGKDKKGVSSLTLLSLKTGKALKTHAPKEFGRIVSPVFSPDGRFLAFGDGDSKVRVVSLSDWKFLPEVFKHGVSPTVIQFSGKRGLMAGAYGNALRVYALPDLRLVLNRDSSGSSDTDWDIYDLAFAVDDSFVAALVMTTKNDKVAYSVKFLDIKK